MADLRHLILLALTAVQVVLGNDPMLEILPDNILKAVGDGVYLSCTAKVDNTELVTEMSWTNPKGEKILNNIDSVVSTTEDGTLGKLDLIINKLTEADVGTYICSATYAGNQKLEQSVMVEAFTDINFGDTPAHQTLLIGQEGVIKCTPKAKPAPQVDWYKNQVALKNDENHIIRIDGIHIPEVTEADEGTYRCRARVPQLGSIKQVNIQVEVYIPPVIDSPPQDMKGKETEDVKFECGATGKPAPEYSWVDKDNRPLEDLEGYHVNRDTGDLTILHLKPEQSGEYRCTATNSAGEDVKTAVLQVLTKPRVEQYLNLTMPVASTAEMRCVVTGNPEPLVVFKKESEPEDFVSGINADDRISVTQETDDEGRQVGVLKIRDLARSDDGLYTCTAQSDGGVTQRWGHITVEFKPTFEDQGPTVEWSWEKAPVNLTCLATSIPNATIQWYLRNQEIDYNDVNLQRLELGPKGVLRINPVSTSYFGIYTCEATNTHGSASLDLELKEAHAPGPVASAREEKMTATTITWSLVDPADNGGLPIQSYIVEYRENDQPWDGATRLIWTKGSSYTIDNLTPQKTYVFRFAARSKAGDGEWGGETSKEMPRHAQPEEPLIFAATDRVVEIPYPSHYDLQWQVPLDNGREIDHFQIVYYQVKEKDGKWEAVGDKTTREVKYPGNTNYKIEGLRVDSHYKIELRAHNDIGYSTPAEAIIKTANGPLPDTAAREGGLSTGIIAAIIVIALLVVLVVIDVSCFFTRNAGLTATIAGKRSATDKDKEAMLEDGKNPREEIQEGNGQMKTQKDDDLKKEPEEDSNKKVKDSEPTETTPMIQSFRHSFQPTATAMLRLEPSPRRAASQENILDTPEAAPRQPRFDNLPRPPPPQYPPPPPPNTRPFKPVIVGEIMKNQTEGDGRPFTMQGPQNGIRLVPLAESKQQSAPLDQSFEDYGDSLYARINDEDANTFTDEPQILPILPHRNVVSRSQEMLSDPLAMHNKEDAGRKRLVESSQHIPSSREELNILGMPPHIPGSPDIPIFGSRDGVRRVIDDPTSKSKLQPLPAPRNRDILNQRDRTFAQDIPTAFPMSRVKEGSTQASPRSSSREALSPGSSAPILGRSVPVSLTNGSREVNGDGRTQSPALSQASPRSGSKEALNIGSLEPTSLSQSREMAGKSRKQSPAPTIASLRSGSREELNGESRMDPPVLGSSEEAKPGSKGTRRPSKTPSVSSNSTLYQPADGGNQYPTRTAVIIAPYDDPGFQTRQQPLSSHQPLKNMSNSHVTARTSGQPGAQIRSPLARGLNKEQFHQIVRLPGLQSPKTKSNYHKTPKPTVHASKTDKYSKSSQHSPFVRTPDPEMSPQVSARLGFHDSSQHPSHSFSMDHLDGPMDTQWPELSPDHRQPVISMAKSLSSLLDSSSSSMRSYGQPTLL